MSGQIYAGLHPQRMGMVGVTRQREAGSRFRERLCQYISKPRMIRRISAEYALLSLC